MNYDLPPFLQQSTFVVLDTETLGVDPAKHGIVEIGALRVSRGRVTGALTVCVQQSADAVAAGAEAMRINQITGDEVRGGVTPYRALVALAAFVADCDLVVGHNIGFDREMIGGEARRHYGGEPHPAMLLPVLCTQALAWGATPKCYALKLTKVCEEFGVPTGQAHRAFGDVLSTAALLPAVLRRHTFSSIDDAAERCKVWRGEVRAYFSEKGR